MTDKLAIAALAWFSMLTIAGCGTGHHDDAPVGLGKSSGQAKVGLDQMSIRITEFSFEGFECELTSVNGERTLRLVMGYASTQLGGQDSYMLRVSELSSRLPILLGFYLTHAALKYAETGMLLYGVRVLEIDGDAPQSGSPRQQWWFSGGENAEYCKETLAIREGSTVTQVLEGHDQDARTWVPLTRKSYDTWWSSVDRALGLTKIFGEHRTSAGTPREE